MKAIKLFLLGLFTTCSIGVSNAQIAIRGGYNFSTVSDGNKQVLNNVESTNGWYVGIYKEFPFLVKDILYLVPELQYSQQGFKDNLNGDIKMEYINIPVLAKIYIAKIVSLETGPQFGFLITDNGPDTYSFNTLDTAWAAGAGINLPFGLSITGRFFGSFNEAVKGSGSKNQVFQAGLAYRFKK